MTTARYDIFRKHESEPEWIEAAHDLTFAKKRIKELAAQSGDEYVLYDHRKKQMIEIEGGIA